MSYSDDNSVYTTSSSSHRSPSLYSIPPTHRCSIPDSVGRTLERFVGRVASSCGYGPYAISERIMRMPIDVLWADEKTSVSSNISEDSKRRIGRKDDERKQSKKLKGECYKLLEYT